MSGSDDFTSQSCVRDAQEGVREDGFFLIEDGYDLAICSQIAQWMERHEAGEGEEVNYGGSELRIWNAQLKDRRAAEFFSACNQFLSSLEQADREAFNLLAIRNRALPPDDERSRVGRWHLDSFRRQYKIFLFLSDVTAQTGPLEFIPGTHKPAFKARGLVTGRYLKPGDLVKGKRSYQVLDERWIDRLEARGYEPTAVVCKAGTVLVIDTSAIHRARPCLEGTRYALTAYYH